MEPTRKIEKVGMRNLRMEDYDQLAKSFRRIYADSDVFWTKEQIKKLAIDGAKLLKKLADETEGNFSFEYSPESFHGTEVDYAVDVCNAVLDVLSLMIRLWAVRSLSSSIIIW